MWEIKGDSVELEDLVGAVGAHRLAMGKKTEPNVDTSIAADPRVCHPFPTGRLRRSVAGARRRLRPACCRQAHDSGPPH